MIARSICTSNIALLFTLLVLGGAIIDAKEYLLYHCINSLLFEVLASFRAEIATAI